MNFLESVGALTLIAGGLYYYFKNIDKQEASKRSEEKGGALLINHSQNTGAGMQVLEPVVKQSGLEPHLNEDKQRGALYREHMKRLKFSLNQWTELYEDDNIVSSFKTIIEDFLLPYGVDYNKFMTNTAALDDPFGHITFEDNKDYSQTLTQFHLNASKAPGYPDWFYAAFPDVAMWAISGEGNKLFHAKYSTYTEAELLNPINKKRLSDTILREVLDSYISTGHRLECQV